MSDTTLLNALERVDRALLAEIELLQEGRFEDLRDLQAETASAMQGLDALQARPDLSIFDAVRVNRSVLAVSQRADRARSLLASALNGARSAQARIEGLLQQDGQIGAYDRSGSPIAMKASGSPYNKTL